MFGTRSPLCIAHTTSFPSNNKKTVLRTVFLHAICSLSVQVSIFQSNEKDRPYGLSFSFVFGISKDAMRFLLWDLNPHKKFFSFVYESNLKSNMSITQASINTQFIIKHFIIFQIHRDLDQFYLYNNTAIFFFLVL